MSYNIRHGERIDSVLDLSSSAKIIKSQTPDLCALQEVDNFCSRSNNIEQIEYLSSKINMKGTFGKFMDFGGGEYGMATLIAKPILSTEVVTLPDGKYEPRVSIIHKVQASENIVILFANVHFDWIDGKEGSQNRLKQAKALVKHINTLNLPCIIAGDFNCTPDSPTMQYLKNQGFLFVNKGKDNLSFQGSNKVEIDHVVYKNTTSVVFTPVKSLLLKEPLASDHRPLVVDFEVTLK
ncbi:endonuclease/exonuclease/phosphatase family protein [Tenacibaculum sp.]|uniref:endonuclease/exonuclease/phosphatase family protein n=1 Tax=Tenacibaculum sp. TaxID=1906242 RepID=UPI003AA7BD76